MPTSPSGVDPLGEKVYIFGWEGAGIQLGLGAPVIEQMYMACPHFLYQGL